MNIKYQLRDQVWDQVWDQVEAQVWDQVWDQVMGQVRDQVRDQVLDQVWEDFIKYKEQCMPNQNVNLEGWSQRFKSSPNETLVDQIAYYARVSNPTSQANSKKNDRLIHYLIRHKHWSPFEMVNVSLEIDTTRDIGRQLIRHRSFSFQEFSQRYSATETVGTFREARKQDSTNRQNSLESNDEELTKWWNDSQKSIQDLSFKTYDMALKKDLAKEVVRSILPEGLTWSRLYVNGTIRSWIHYIEMRTDPSTQKEHRELAIMCAREISKVFPMINDFVYDEERQKEKDYSLYLDLRSKFENNN